jgi:hypothetical protein
VVTQDAGQFDISVRGREGREAGEKDGGGKA